MSLINAAVASIPAVIQPVPVFDLELIDLQVTGITQEADRFEIEFSYTIANAGSTPYDPNGVLPTTTDNAAIQTYLSDGVNPLLPAGGFSIQDAPVLNPGDLYSGTAFSNTADLPNPLNFGDHVWLVVDLFNTGEEPEHLGNNRASAFVPAPATTALACVGVLLARGRRR